MIPKNLRMIRDKARFVGFTIMLEDVEKVLQTLRICKEDGVKTIDEAIKGMNKAKKLAEAEKDVAEKKVGDWKEMY